MPTLLWWRYFFDDHMNAFVLTLYVPFMLGTALHNAAELDVQDANTLVTLMALDAGLNLILVFNSPGFSTAATVHECFGSLGQVEYPAMHAF